MDVLNAHPREIEVIKVLFDEFYLKITAQDQVIWYNWDRDESLEDCCNYAHRVRRQHNGVLPGPIFQEQLQVFDVFTVRHLQEMLLSQDDREIEAWDTLQLIGLLERLVYPLFHLPANFMHDFGGHFRKTNEFVEVSEPTQ